MPRARSLGESSRESSSSASSSSQSAESAIPSPVAPREGSIASRSRNPTLESLADTISLPPLPAPSESWDSAEALSASIASVESARLSTPQRTLASGAAISRMASESTLPSHLLEPSLRTTGPSAAPSTVITTSTSSLGSEDLESNFVLSYSSSEPNNASEDSGQTHHDIPKIYKLYEEEAKKQDAEFVKDRNEKLDTMLVFAGLYATILSAFIVDSTSHLQQDSADVTNALLLNIAQSQWRIETGNSNSSLPPVQLPPFETSTVARTVNCLWYISLVLSLGAALIAMLAKEWLAAFLKYKSQDPIVYSLKRQARYKAFDSWHATTVIDFVPILIYIALLLFTLGLIIQMWPIDFVVAATITSASGVIALFYFWTLIVGTIFDSCPYKSRMSEYISKALRLDGWDDFNKSSTRRDTSTSNFFGLTSVNIQTLRVQRLWDWIVDGVEWFFDNSGDQDMVNDAYTWSVGSTFYQDAFQSIITAAKVGAEQSQSALLKLGQRVCVELKSASMGSHRTVTSKGMNAARYAHILSEITKYTWMHGGAPGGTEHTLFQSELHHLISHTLLALKSFWGVLAPFAPGANAILIAAELKLTAYALRSRRIPRFPQTSSTPSGNVARFKGAGKSRIQRYFHELKALQAFRTGKPSSVSSERFHSSGHPRPKDSASDHLLIEFLDIEELDILDHVRHVLCRGGLALHYHLNQRAPLTPTSLAALASGLHELTSHLESHSTEQLLKPVLAQVAFDAFSVHHSFKTHYFRQVTFGSPKCDGLLAGLIELLGNSSNCSPLSESVEYYAALTLSNIAPRLISHWIISHPSAASHVYYQDGFQWPVCHESVLMDRNLPSPYPVYNPSLNRFIIEQLLETGCFVVAAVHHPSMDELANTTLKAIISRTGTPPDLQVALDYLRSHAGLVRVWNTAAYKARSSSWYQRSDNSILLYRVMLRLFRNERRITEGEQAFVSLLRRQPDRGGSGTSSADGMQLDTVLEAMANATDHPESVAQLFRDLSPHMENDIYIRAFTKGRGFSHLHEIGVRAEPDLRREVVSRIISLVFYISPSHEADLAAGQTVAPELDEVAFSCFLTAVSFVFAHPPDQWNETFRSLLPATMRIIELQGRHAETRFRTSDVTQTLNRVLHLVVKAATLINDTETRETVFRLTRVGGHIPNAEVSNGVE